MLSEKITDLLNKQINLEFFSSNVYLQMSAWCDQEGLEGCAQFLRMHADEEMMHMRKIFDYVLEAGGMSVLGTIEAPQTEFGSIKKLFEDVYEHECLVTRSINNIVQATFAEQDMTTFNFLQWFVAEQHEEETLARALLDRVKVIGLEGQGLYFIDQEVARMAAQEAAEEGGEAA